MSLLLLLKGTGEAPEEVETPSRIAVTQEYQPDRLEWSITPPGGAPARWASDEPLVENIASGTKLADNMPGGDATGECALSRDPRASWPDTGVYGEVEVRAGGGEVVWSGRIDKPLEVDGDHVTISPAAVGHGAELDDVDLVGLGFIDSSLGGWGEMSAAREAALLATETLLSGTNNIGWQDSGEIPPGISQQFEALDGGHDRIVEAWKYGGGIRLGGLLYDRVERAKAFTSTEAWDTIAGLVDSDQSTSTEGNYTNHKAADATQQHVVAFVESRRYARLFFHRITQGEELSGSTWAVNWENVKILSYLAEWNLVLQGAWPNVGYTAKQMLGLVIPLYTSLTADAEDLEDSGYVIQHAWYPDGGKLSPIIKDITKYELLDWFVFGKRFQLRFPGTYGNTWHAYAGPSQLQESGEDGSRLWREIIVAYQDVDGTTKTVGPLGSGADIEDGGLEVTDPDHPAVKADLPRRDRLVLRGISTPSRAIEAGEYWLSEANELTGSGSAAFSGFLLDGQGVFRPVSQIRAGDRVIFGDAADQGARRIVHRDYDDDAKTTTVELDAPSDKYNALLDRMQADIEALQLA